MIRMRHRLTPKVAKPFLVIAATLCVFVAIGLSAAYLVPLPERLQMEPSTVVRFRDGSMGFVFLSEDEKWRIYADPSLIDPHYVKALLTYEDSRFYFHPGVDPFALTRAVAQNLWSRSVVSGASTITMQLVRVLEPRPRSIASKLLEALRAIQLEMRLSKKDILSAYMTFVSFGKNLEGVETASWSYFGHGASHLTPAEIATLLSVPQLPAKRFPTLTHKAKLTQARDKILNHLYQRHVFGEDDVSLADSLHAAVPEKLRPFPRNAAHLAFWLHQNARVTPDEHGNIVTTIDPAIQKLVSHLSQREARDAADRGVYNHAVVVVHQQTGAVVAVIGGMDFWNRKHGSQIAGFQIPRSPGSLMKPFIYADAIDLGLTLPDRLVPDIPKDYGGYMPKNYDGNFSRLVRLEDALSKSLNIPFVNLLAEVGLERFLGTISQAGIARIMKAPGFYGLSVAAGGIELTALEVAGLYATLANGGTYHPLFWEKENAPKGDVAGLRLFSEGATWLTRKALRLRDRPDFPRRRDFTKTPPDVFWKTGTSFGHRDAWSAGSAGDYTAVVWFGNVDYAPSHALIGADMAAPLLFDILEGLTNRHTVEPDFKPESVTEVEVCAFSGYLAGPACEHTRKVQAIGSNVPHEACPFHVEMEVDKKSGLAVGPMCRADKVTERRKYMNWPAGVRRYLSRTNRVLPDVPRIHPSCIYLNPDHPIRITSPTRNKVHFMIPGMPADKQEIPFIVDTGNGGDEVSWFIDGQFLKTVRADTQVWWQPTPGSHEVSVVTVGGTVARQSFSVQAF